MESCLYEGRVAHRRSRPVEHAFSFPLLMLYLDLDELPGLFRGRWLWSARRPALARFRRRDHLGDPELPLDRSVRDLVQERSGIRPAGPIRLLTHLRYAGYVFNPLSLYYCFDGDSGRIEAVVADVTNTPWGERHCYVLPRANAREREGTLHFVTPKELHVSPFMGMDLDYHWTLGDPGRSLRVRIENRERRSGRFFDAQLSLERREIGGRSLARALVRYPLMTAQVIGAIHWQALRLRRKGAPWFPHPGEANAQTGLAS